MSIIETTATELTPRLLKAYDCEKVIEQGLASFVDVGCALFAIKAEGLHRDLGYDTFEDYCRERWDIGGKYAYRLIAAASIALEVSPIGDIDGVNPIPAPRNEAQVRPLSAVPAEDRADVWAEAVEAAGGDQPTAKQVEQAVAKRQPPKKDHPAPFSDPILAKVREHLTETGTETGTVLDPFAGTGRVHELATDERRTIGVEIEAEWAARHPDTIHGDALALTEHVEPGSVDAIATSPTYGNRMADHHDAADDSVRLTYKHTLGHDLADNNSGQMQWGPEYRAFHEDVWAEAVRALKPGGTLTINVKNHIRGGEVQRVVEWHIMALVALDLTLVALDAVPTRGLMAGANADTRTAHEFVATFRKDADQ